MVLFEKIVWLMRLFLVLIKELVGLVLIWGIDVGVFIVFFWLENYSIGVLIEFWFFNSKVLIVFDVLICFIMCWYMVVVFCMV